MFSRAQLYSLWLNLVLLTCLVGTAQECSATIIDTTPEWMGGGLSALGGNGVSAIGQTFTAPSDAHLDSVTFYIANFQSTASTEYQAYVVGWNNQAFQATGAVLYQSAVLNSTAGTTQWDAITLNPDVQLQPGFRYVAFLGTFGLFQSLSQQLQVAIDEQAGIYSGGDAVYFGDNATYAQLSSIFTKQWLIEPAVPSGSDLAIRLAFSVPEPLGLIQGAVGAATLILFCTMRRRRLRIIKGDFRE